MIKSRLNPIKPKILARNKEWLRICMGRAEYLIEKYGFIICEYSGEAITILATLPVSLDAGWGHHIDRNRNHVFESNCYIVKYKYHSFITDYNINVKQEGFEGYELQPKHKPQVQDRTKHIKGNGDARGRSSGHTIQYNDVGIFYPGGMGCPLSNNCFECPRHAKGLDCNFGSNNPTNDFVFLSNRGNGIKVW